MLWIHRSRASQPHPKRAPQQPIHRSNAMRECAKRFYFFTQILRAIVLGPDYDKAHRSFYLPTVQLRLVSAK